MIRRVVTENGVVEGLPAADPRITAFKGIPFAAPPVGENRWRAPQPCKKWEGVLEAYKFAPISVQDTPGIGDNIYVKEWHVDSEIPMGEDCLYLNVWTNAKSENDNLPVMVWYYGGGLQWGYPAEMEFDGERIARRDIVVVTVNYRINVFGFMAHPEITKESPEAPANFGNLDQQAGLKWVKRNIRAFGGNPDNITISGQSAGGGSVMSQMTCPANEGLFQKAIVMSAMIKSPYGEFSIGHPETLAEAEKNGEEFLEYLGVKNLAEARKLDAFFIRDKYAEYANTHRRMFTVQDDIFCLGDPMTRFTENKHIKVQIMSGNTADEFPNSIKAKDEAELEKRCKEIFGDRAEEFLSFNEAHKKLDAEHFAPVNGIECTIKNLFLKNRQNGNMDNCYYYRFDAEIPGEDNPGTFHSVDLWFFFETLAKCWRPFQGRHYDLARIMCNYMTNFIRNGNPNGKDNDGTDMPEWKSYSKDEPFEMVFRSDGIKTNCSGEKPFIKFLMDNIGKLLEE